LSAGSCGAYGSFATIATGPSSVYPDTTVTSGNCYMYQYVAADNVGNTTTATSVSVVKVDTTGPSGPTLGYSALTNTYASGNTVYYRSTATSGSFTATASSTDSQSGIASYSFGSAGAGWTSTPGATGVNTYSWASSSPTTTSPTVSATNNAGTTSTGNPTITLTSDAAAPTGASVSYTNGYVTALSVPVTFSAGSDAGSGINSAAGLLQRASATLSGASCGAYGSFATIATGPSSVYSDTTVTSGNCYMYQFVAVDNVGNTAAAATSASVTKVDTTGPGAAPLSYSALTNTYASRNTRLL
jgi:hypothetical protein